MMHIISNLSSEKITDCLEENMENNQIKVTYGDTLAIDGMHYPREVYLTDPDCHMIKERLDYILWLNRG